MALNILEHGIVHRADSGAVFVYRLGRLGRIESCIEVSEYLADEHRLATGDVIEGSTTPSDYEADIDSEENERLYSDDEQLDEPLILSGKSILRSLPTLFPMERLTSITRINGLSAEDAESRPNARKRKTWERTEPKSALPVALNSNDTTGRLLDLAAPYASGSTGMIYGPHATGLTRTLRSVVAGVTQNQPEAVAIVLLFRARGEEITDWRRRFPDADVIACPAPQHGGTPEQTLLIADLALACAMRQTELEKDVLLAVDSFTGLWSAMLEVEEDDSQRSADRSRARSRMREWIQNAGCFGGEGPLGGSLGGSLSIVGTLWHTDLDLEEEADGELHPHLRLFEHILHDTTWRVPLSQTLARERLFPAIEILGANSLLESRIISDTEFQLRAEFRSALKPYPLVRRHITLLDAMDSEAALEGILHILTQTANE